MKGGLIGAWLICSPSGQVYCGDANALVDLPPFTEVWVRLGARTCFTRPAAIMTTKQVVGIS
ncbi:hypothetical protein DENIT_20116 [Pseudomonas veronii]|nr:hypothetical protein DENIT_20116 [Pseudomonas veronii]